LSAIILLPKTATYSDCVAVLQGVPKAKQSIPTAERLRHTLATRVGTQSFYIQRLTVEAHLVACGMHKALLSTQPILRTTNSNPLTVYWPGRKKKVAAFSRLQFTRPLFSVSSSRSASSRRRPSQ